LEKRTAKLNAYDLRGTGSRSEKPIAQETVIDDCAPCRILVATEHVRKVAFADVLDVDVDILYSSEVI
jgi:hypothetical protein